MSSAAVLLDGQLVHLISDTAATIGGRLMGHAAKTLPIPHLGLAVAVRGNTKSVKVVHHLISEYDDLDQMVNTVPMRLRATGGLFAKWWPARYGFDVYIAGVRDGRTFAYTLDSRTGYAFREIEWVAASGLTDLDALRTAVDGFDTDRRGDTRQLDDAAIRLGELQRLAAPGQVGGALQMTTVTSGGIWTRIIKRWPEKLGEKIVL